MNYTVGTAFSGIGVPDLAARLLGMETKWQIERDAFCQQVLRKNFPEAVLYGDIFDVHNPPHVDVFVAGFPCQPFSVAGRRQGERDERYLVPEMLRIIDETAPRVCLLENVPGFANLDDGRTFKRLLGALAEMGMDAEWGHLRASDFGAPHQRERWWLVAYTDGRRRAIANGGRGNSLRDFDGYSTQEERGRHELELGTSANGQLGYAGSGGFAGGTRRRAGAQLKNGSLSRSEIGINPQSRLGRILDGVAARLDGFVPYPARPGEAQYAFEPPRVTSRKDQRANRLKALGNTMAFDVAFALTAAIQQWLIEIDTAQAASTEVAA